MHLQVCGGGVSSQKQMLFGGNPWHIALHVINITYYITYTYSYAYTIQIYSLVQFQLSPGDGDVVTSHPAASSLHKESMLGSVVEKVL